MSATEGDVTDTISVRLAADELGRQHAGPGDKVEPLASWRAIQRMSKWLVEAREACRCASPELAKAAEWLLDNDYQVHRAIRQVSQDMPADFYRRLPPLAEEGTPRIFAVAHGLLHSTRLQLSLASAVEFVRSYQKHDTLLIAELWAFPTMLRLACLEVLVAGFSRLFPDVAVPFRPSRHALEVDSFDDIERVARAIANFALIASIPWDEFFDRTSVVEEILSGDPSRVYPLMDFATRDNYRRAVEEISYGSGADEWSIAARAVEQAKAGNDPAIASGHVGYWLVGEGRRELEIFTGYVLRPAASMRRWAARHVRSLYGYALLLLGTGALVIPASYMAAVGAGMMAWVVFAFVAIIPASILAVTIVHAIVTRIVPPRVLPKLDLEAGIPEDCRTLVVVPVLVGSPAEVPGLVERLEAHRLANPDPLLQFALLSDLPDSSMAVQPGDDAIEAALVAGIEDLNARHGTGGQGSFHLLHRCRRFNAREGCWMGWERKRGKLEQLNRLILSVDNGDFARHVGKREALPGIRFVVTVDADTRLPAGSVNRLVGTLAHPLNTARFDPGTGRPTSGYSIIQPRVEVSPESGNGSVFARLFTGDTAIDIYSRAVSDVYQDLFGEGIFVGKGIYDVAAFHRSVDGRIPENAILSHDLFEGLLGRAALATDIVLYESFPESYLEHIRRWHRWIRGDWQLVPWLLPKVPASDGTHMPNPFSRLDRWKIVDNLRRSLIAPALLLFALAGWLVLPGSPWVWTILTLVAPGAHLFTDLVSGLARGPRRGSIRGLFGQIGDQTGRWFLAVAFLPKEAVTSLHAISTVLWRIFVSRRHLLEWTSAAQVARLFRIRRSRTNVWLQMWAAPLFAAASAAAVLLLRPASIPAAVPLLALWLVSPEIALWIGRPRRVPEEPLKKDERDFLRRLARRTWLYFETFAGPEDHWLPPDNYQEVPYEEIAHRTSPTNIGMMLVSGLTAWDLGHIGLPEFAARVANSLDSMDSLEHHRGHLLNWYDTRSLEPLEPRYVSTVDSGNLAVCLVALAGGCKEAAAAPLFGPQRWQGLLDVLGIIEEAAGDFPRPAARAASQALGRLRLAIQGAREAPATWHAALAEIADIVYPAVEDVVVDAVSNADDVPSAALAEVSTWMKRLVSQVQSMRRDLGELAPWLQGLSQPPPQVADYLPDLVELLLPDRSLDELDSSIASARTVLSKMAPVDEAAAAWIAGLSDGFEAGMRAQQGLAGLFRSIAARASAIAFGMDFAPLYDRERRLFHIGYNVSSDRLDPHHYDLLATEARIASYFAIAKRDVPAEHWFFLGRPLTREDGEISLLSWNGSMFEYLMAPIFLRSGPETLMGESERVAVDIQRSYARRMDVPWGISESAFAVRDPEHRYRYQAFGSPGLGLKRDLGRDLVIAPYASALALTTTPRLAVENLKRLWSLGAGGLYGMFEAVDFTSGRSDPRRSFMPVRAYMAHHQGMILSAIDNLLNEDVLVRRFREDPRMRTVDLLLSERVPREVPSEIERIHERQPLPQATPAFRPPAAWSPSASETFQQVHTLGNGRLASWISDSGGGGLHWRHRALTRFVADSTRGHQGLWIYVSDEESGALWSATRQPTNVQAEEYRVTFHPHLAEFHRRDHTIALRTEICVAEGDDVEIRRVTIVNESSRRRVLRLTSYGEVVLAPPLDDERHPAFSKLFVRSEPLSRLNGLLFSRRARHPHEAPPVLIHRLIASGPKVKLLSFDCDRRAFLGRNGDLRRPRAISEGLSNSHGWTLDPILALQARIELAPHETRELSFLTIAAGSRQSALEVAERYSTPSALDWAFDDTATAVARETHQSGIESDRFPELQSLVARLIYSHPSLRAGDDIRRSNILGQPQLWGLGLSGDRPILLLKLKEGDEASLLNDLIAGHRLWIKRGIEVDLVLLKLAASSYLEPTRDQITSLLAARGAHEYLGRKGGIHLLSADQIGPDMVRLLESVAHVVLDDARGNLRQQLAAVQPLTRDIPSLQASPGTSEQATPELERPHDLLFDNGTGGFRSDGREYLIHLGPGQRTPAPWSNLLANDQFGCLVTEAGGGFTWSINSGENRLTPWSNDPVSDTPGEVLYLRDEETGAVWTPTPFAAGEATCQVVHGIGYTRWLQRSHQLEQELLVFVPPDEPVKLARVRLRNLSNRPRRITATYYAEWQLGALRSTSVPSVVTEFDSEVGAILARNPWNPDFAERVAFLAATQEPHSLTLDRYEFLGREDNLRNPAALQRWGLSGNVSSRVDPCAACQVHLDLGPGEEREVIFALGQGENRKAAEALARRWQDPSRFDEAMQAVKAHWSRLLDAVQVKTPDPAFDTIVNCWLLYQTISSRICARAGFYQAGGAIGFRDQLQDMMAVLHVDPPRVRAHILACAAHQFEEGDVMHWWHPPTDRGVRTRCSDDLLWLPFVVARYVEATGDTALLTERAPFLRAAPLAAEEQDRYSRFDVAPADGTIFDHCVRALEHGVTRGQHGLPLIGSGDWNDGMDRIGSAGRGESVWLAWFSVVTLEAFAPLASLCDRKDLAVEWLEHAAEVRAAAEEHGWDGDWYRRAFDDNGEPWGSAANDECRIDSISQSWAVLAGANAERARKAIESATRELVVPEHRLVRLLTPPFDATVRDPGYIKSYPPGVRENGGQYTHAATWLGFAYARLGDGDRAFGIFNLLNPVHLSSATDAAERYRVEPYVVTADVADGGALTGRGGWSWYTGSSAWLWRLGVEGILGLTPFEGGIRLAPCLPRSWGRSEVTLVRPGGSLHISIEDPQRLGTGELEIRVNDEPWASDRVSFPTDGSTWTVRACIKPSRIHGAEVREQAG